MDNKESRDFLSTNGTMYSHLLFSLMDIFGVSCSLPSESHMTVVIESVFSTTSFAKPLQGN